MHVYSIIVLASAMPVISVPKLPPELSLIVTATSKETPALVSKTISSHLSRPIGSKIYFQGYSSTRTALGYSIA